MSAAAVLRGRIMTTAEIQNLTCTADLTGLLNRRYLRAITSGGLGTPHSAPSQSRDLSAM